MWFTGQSSSLANPNVRTNFSASPKVRNFLLRMTLAAVLAASVPLPLALSVALTPDLLIGRGGALAAVRVVVSPTVPSLCLAWPSVSVLLPTAAVPPTDVPLLVSSLELP